MAPATTTLRRIALRADASPAVGVGHVVRTLALADEMVSRGWTVALFGEVRDVPWLQAAVAERALPLIPARPDPVGLAEDMTRWGADGAVLDGYHIDPGTGRVLRRTGRAVLSVQDGEFGSGQEADLLLDQNLGASDTYVPAGTAALLGLDYVLFRDEMLAVRDLHRPTRQDPDVLVFSGGTDPARAVPLLVELLLATGAAMSVTAVAVDATAHAQIQGLHCARDQHVEIISPTPHLITRAAVSDLAVCAAGSSLWELMCLGVPAAVVAVSDNQQPTLDLLQQEPIAHPLGQVGRLRSDQGLRDTATGDLRVLLSSPSTRNELAARARQRIDGRGRRRVVDAFAAVLQR